MYVYYFFDYVAEGLGVVLCQHLLEVRKLPTQASAWASPVRGCTGGEGPGLRFSNGVSCAGLPPRACLCLFVLSSMAVFGVVVITGMAQP